VVVIVIYVVYVNGSLCYWSHPVLVIFYFIVSSQHTYYHYAVDSELQCSVTPRTVCEQKSANTQREANEETLQKMSNAHDVVVGKSLVITSIFLRQQHVIK
jgi:hypothetical protein